MSRHVFKVRRPDGTVVEVEKWAESRAAALPFIEAWVATHWPGAKVLP